MRALELGAHALGAPLVDQELRARARALLAIAVVAEDRGQLVGDLDDVVEAREHAEPPAHPRRRSEASTDPDVVAETQLGVRHADEPDVVDLVLRAVVAARADRHLELAGEVREAPVPHEVGRQLVDDRARVEELVRGDARERAADDVAPDVAARLRAGQADPVERREDLGDVLDPEPVQLDALARRHVAGRAPEAHGEVADRPQLLRRDRAVRHADPQHQEAVLLGPLRVQAPPLRELEVVGRERVEPAAPRRDQQVGQDVETVLALLDALDLRAKVPRFSSSHSIAPVSSMSIHQPP